MAIRTEQDALIDGIRASVDKGYAPRGFLMVTGTGNTTATSGTYFAVHFVTDCTLTTFTVTNSTTVTVTHKAGSTVYGDITAITAGSSETYMLYKN
tara:strand:- start:564 stop:851 length:288 start_codon:yes stop_codon:yes gene_type:complete